MEPSITDRKPNTVALVEKIAEDLGRSATAGLVFGDPVERGGITVIPVAKIRYAFGGRSGNSLHMPGAGGGGGLRAAPLGYIEIRNGSSRFCPILDIQAISKIVLGTLFLGMLAVGRRRNCE